MPIYRHKIGFKSQQTIHLDFSAFQHFCNVSRIECIVKILFRMEMARHLPGIYSRKFQFDYEQITSFPEMIV